jgi:O-antigen/teichoic acid export membrane protein
MDAIRIGGQVFYVFGGGIFTFLVGLPLQIYVVRSLGAGQFGAYSVVEGALGTIAGLLAFGIAPTAVRFIPQHLARGESGHVRSLVGIATFVLLAIGAAGAVFTALFSQRVIAWWGLNGNVQSVIAVMVLTIPIGLLTFLYQQILRGFQEIFIMILISSVVTLTAKAALSVLFINSGLGTVGYAWAVVLSSGFGLTLMMAAAIRLLWRLNDTGEQFARPMRLWVRYASILYANGLFSTVVQYLDRFVVGALIGAEGVATLVVDRQLQQMPQTLFNMFVVVVGPMFASTEGSRRQSIYQVTTDWCMRLGLPLILFLIVFAAPILTWYGHDIAMNGTLLLRLLLLSMLISMVCGPIGNYLMMTGNELNMFRVTIAQTVTMIAGYLILIPLFGIAGVGIAAVFYVLLGNALAFRIARHKLHHVWWASRYTAWLLPAALSFSGLLAIRAALGWNESGPTVWLAVGLSVAYVSFFAGNFVSGFHVEDRAVFDAVKARLRYTVGFRG